MMRYSLTILENQWESLKQAVFGVGGLEGAAYILCGKSITENETRLIAREIIPVNDAHYLVRAPDRLSISSESYVPIVKRAGERRESIIFVHSHPESVPTFSLQDDHEDPRLQRFFAARVPAGVHGSIVISNADTGTWDGRIWSADDWSDLYRIRIIGKRFRFLQKEAAADEQPIPEFFDRQVKAFGPDVQRLLSHLNIGVVGAGGTGSAIIEQLTRLGVGTLSIFDFDNFEGSNVNRVYGSGVSDAGKAKIEIVKTNIHRIGLGTVVREFPKGIRFETGARAMRDCDIVFGCTDKHAPRGILVQLALRYFIPVFDVGAKIESEEGIIRGIYSRVTTLLPGEACLFCRGRINSKTIALESLPADQRAALVKEGYADELETNAPAVIMFTTAAATQAVCELVHRLTGFMGADRQSTEVLMRFHSTSINRNREQPGVDCLCNQKQLWGRGDSRSFLDLAWPSEN